MATSKNKRKNGKTIKSNTVKRMRRMAGYDLKNLMICNVVDYGELDGGNRMIPRTLTYDTKLKRIVSITRLQEVALKSERWRWEVHYGVICRNPDGTVYLDKEVNFLCKEEYLLKELNDTITDSLMESFDKANHLHRLTMFWVASPIEQDRIPVEAVLAPVWHFNVLGNMLTQWETEKTDHVVVHYRTDKLTEFVGWFLEQGKHKAQLQQERDLSFRFEATGQKMQKGDLQHYRLGIQETWQTVGLDTIHPVFSPLATVKGFTSVATDLTCSGLQMSALMTALDKCPPCISCIVDVRYADGRENRVKFSHKQVEFLGE